MKPFASKVFTINKLLQEAYDRKRKHTGDDSSDEGYSTKKLSPKSRFQKSNSLMQTVSSNQSLKASFQSKPTDYNIRLPEPS